MKSFYSTPILNDGRFTPNGPQRGDGIWMGPEDSLSPIKEDNPPFTILQIQKLWIFHLSP